MRGLEAAGDGCGIVWLQSALFSAVGLKCSEHAAAATNIGAQLGCRDSGSGVAETPAVAFAAVLSTVNWILVWAFAFFMPTYSAVSRNLCWLHYRLISAQCLHCGGGVRRPQVVMCGCVAAVSIVCSSRVEAKVA
jgi:hypothetical protein